MRLVRDNILEDGISSSRCDGGEFLVVFFAVWLGLTISVRHPQGGGILWTILVSHVLILATPMQIKRQPSMWRADDVLGR